MKPTHRAVLHAMLTLDAIGIREPTTRDVLGYVQEFQPSYGYDAVQAALRKLEWKEYVREVVQSGPRRWKLR